MDNEMRLEGIIDRLEEENERLEEQNKQMLEAIEKFYTLECGADNCIDCPFENIDCAVRDVLNVFIKITGKKPEEV
jgi:hypothetical protein